MIWSLLVDYLSIPCYDITEILLKVVLNTITPSLYPSQVNVRNLMFPIPISIFIRLKGT
jgi:hypothetical protein